MLEKITYKDVWRFTMHYWRRRKMAGIALVVLMLMATAIEPISPVITGRIVDALANPPGPETNAEIAKYFGFLLLIGLSFNLLRWGAMMLWNWFAVRNLYEILIEGMRKVQHFSSDWHANAFAGGTVRKITRGMWAFNTYGDTLFMGLMPAILILFAMTGMLMWHLPWVGVFVAVMAVIYCAFSIWVALAILAPKFRESADTDTKVGATLSDIITGNAAVKSFGAEAREEGKFNRVATFWRLRSQRAWFWSENINLIRGLIRTIMYAGMIGFTILMWQNGTASAGDVALSITSYFIISGYLRDIGMHIANLQRSVSEMEDIISFWIREDEVSDAPGAKPLNITHGEIVFKDVGFHYQKQKKPLFENLSLTIKPGEKIALVGPSGSGKSTFVKLIQRLYDVTDGAVLIDGQNVAAVTQESLRRNIALVPQDPILFHRSLAANIAYGRPGARMEAIIDAAKQAYAHEFIEGLPSGYATLVGERGVKLSGGERQRVAIARAILADTPILILDEATSSLDSISEHYIQKALEALMRGRTSITIAHRLSTIRSADRILVFSDGKIVEQGTHAELIVQADSYYKKLHSMQEFI
jgi:ATP-binding cassette subfamily B protein